MERKGILTAFILISGEALALGLPAREFLHQMGCKNIRFVDLSVMLRALTFLSNQLLRTGASPATTIHFFCENGLHLLFIISFYRPWRGGLALEGVVVCIRPFIEMLY